ncbi:MAG: nicotinate mononucleotide-dependent phosphoribosyltransferase CobT [Microcoleaceae cyanobacterium]
MIRVYTGLAQGRDWLERFSGHQPIFACILGFTKTGLIPGISAAGATPADRQYTCLADAEFLCDGPQPDPQYALPPLQAGASPVLISRAVIEGLSLPIHLFNAGLPLAPSVAAVDLGGQPADCVSSGQAMSLSQVKHLFEQGMTWGQKLSANQSHNRYLILSECVVGGTTTALAVLLGLGVAAHGKVNSSHVHCNHVQKQAIVESGLRNAGLKSSFIGHTTDLPDPLKVVAAVGDPMQIVVAGMAIAASRTVGVLLAGGTQMLAVYRLIQTITAADSLTWQPENIVVGTTRWVVEDSTGDTVGLAETLGSIPLLATQLSFANSRYPQLQAYEQGYVKEGVGAGGCAIAASLSLGWDQMQLLQQVEGLLERCLNLQS